MAKSKKAKKSTKTKAKAKPAKKSAKPEAQVEVDSEVGGEPGPRAERGVGAIACSQCDGTIDGGALRIVLDAGEALHPSCTFGWTLDHFTNTTATADWMATMMQRSRLSPEDRSELLEELGAPSA